MTKQTKPLKSVYAYYFPEVRTVVKQAIEEFPQELLLKSIFPGLDNYHQPLIDKYISKSTDYQKGLELFPYQYYCNGSSEAIFQLLVQTLRENKNIYIFKGEYEGYKEYTKNLGGEIIEIDKENFDPKSLELGRFFISNPSAIDGNILPNTLINQIGDWGHEMVIDLAYLGLTKKYQIDLTHPKIIAVIASLSKPYGLFYYRVGFAFTKVSVPTLYANKWFKNILSIYIGEKVLNKFGFGYFYQKYKSLQSETIKTMNQELRTNTSPSDVLLLAQTKNCNNPELQEYKRHNIYRFCLTPYFLMLG